MAIHILYVDGVHGNDGNNCKSRKTACKTIGHAISLASPDDAILVGPATYAENLTINFNLGIIGSGASTTIIDGQGLNTVVTIPNEATRLVLAGFTIRNGNTNYVNEEGGGIDNNRILTIFDTVISENRNAFGAGIYNDGTLTLDRVAVSDNEGYGDYFGGGAGIFNFGTLTINDSTISGNSSETTDMSGGGISNGGTLVVNRSTISGNSTGGYGTGGGIDNGRGTATINNSTVYGNVSTIGAGGGISNELNGVVTISNSTITGNAASFEPGGINDSQGGVFLQNSIVADNGGNCFGTMYSNGYNLSSDNTCSLNGAGRSEQHRAEAWAFEEQWRADTNASGISREPDRRRGEPKRLHRRPRTSANH